MTKPSRKFTNFYSRTSCEVRRHRHVAHQHSLNTNFYSRTSCEVRPIYKICLFPSMKFLLTHLLRGATLHSLSAVGGVGISTHAPLARCDNAAAVKSKRVDISTHAPLARCDDFRDYLEKAETISTHAPLARCDDGLINAKYSIKISTHAPLARCDFLPMAPI